MTPAPPGQSARELIDRVRTSLPDDRLREVRMFGVIAIMIDNAMAVAVHKDGSAPATSTGSMQHTPERLQGVQTALLTTASRHPPRDP